MVRIVPTAFAMALGLTLRSRFRRSRWTPRPRALQHKSCLSNSSLIATRATREPTHGGEPRLISLLEAAALGKGRMSLTGKRISYRYRSIP